MLESRNWSMQSCVTDAVWSLPARLSAAPAERDVWYNTVHDMQARITRELIGPRAPQRKRPKRVAKKLARRGDMLRCNGFVQSFYRAWPVLAWLREGAK